MTNTNTQVVDQHRKIFGQEQLIIASPGRVNIIGEHTDYNNGLVLPYALDRHIYMAASTNDTGHLRIYSIDKKRYVDFSLNEGIEAWCNYFIQVMDVMNKKHPNLKSIDITIASNLPSGAGVSSSSSLTCGFIFLIDQMNHLEMTKDEMVEVSILAEHGTGVRGGAMDQTTIIKARKNEAMVIDFSDSSTEYIPLDLGENCFYLVYSDVQHSLVDSEYNIRRKECEEAVNHISQYYKKIDNLSQLSVADFPNIQLPEKLWERASFIIEENQRVRDVIQCLRDKSFVKLGLILYESHRGLSEKYEVSTIEVDWLINELIQNDDILGARMIGGGFGGSILVLLHPDDINFLNVAVKKYNNKFSKKAFHFPADSSPSISIVS